MVTAGLILCMWSTHLIPMELLGCFCSYPSVSALLCSAKCSDTGGCPDNRRAKVFVAIAVEFLSPSCYLVLMSRPKIPVEL